MFRDPCRFWKPLTLWEDIARTHGVSSGTCGPFRRLHGRNTGPWNFAFCRVQVGCGSFRGKLQGFGPGPGPLGSCPPASWIKSPLMCKKVRCGSFRGKLPAARSPRGYPARCQNSWKQGRHLQALSLPDSGLCTHISRPVLTWFSASPPVITTPPWGIHGRWFPLGSSGRYPWLGVQLLPNRHTNDLIF